MSRHQIITYLTLGLILALQIMNLILLRRQPAPTSYTLTSATPTPVADVTILPVTDNFQNEFAQIRAELRAINQVLGISKSPQEISAILGDASPSALPNH